MMEVLTLAYPEFRYVLTLFDISTLTLHITVHSVMVINQILPQMDVRLTS